MTLDSRKKKILDNLRKGAMKKFPFDPKNVPLAIRGDVHNWQQGGAREQRSALPEIKGNERIRALHKLSAQTKTRRNPTTGEREFLLHRGASGDELKSWVKHGYVLHDKHTSWTPHLGTAQHFSMHYSKPFPDSMTDEGHKENVVSAWIPESAVHHIPMQFGTIHGRGPNRFAHEYEVVIKPNHGSQIAHPDDLNDVSNKTLAERVQLRLKKSVDDDARRIQGFNNIIAYLKDGKYSETPIDERKAKVVKELGEVTKGSSDTVKKYIMSKYNQEPVLDWVRFDIARSLFGPGTNPGPEAMQSGFAQDPELFGSYITDNHKVPLDLIKFGMEHYNHRLKRQLAGNLANYHIDNPESLDILKDNLHNVDSKVINKIVTNPKTSPEVLRFIENNNPSPDQLHHLLSNPNTPQDIVENHLHDEDPNLYVPGGAAGGYRVRPDLSALSNVKNPDIIKRFYENGNQQHLDAIKNNRHVSPEFIRNLVNSGNPKNIAFASEMKAAGPSELHHIANHLPFLDETPRKQVALSLARHKNVDDDLLNKVRHHIGNEHIVGILAHHDPDSIAEIKGKDEPLTSPATRSVNIHSQVDNLKRIKGHLMEIGAPSVRKSELEKRGITNLPPEIVKPNGTVDFESIDNYEKALPKERYNLSYDKWHMLSTDPEGRGDGYYPQMHDLTKPQLVVQLNPSTEHINKLKEKGLYPVYKAMQTLARYGSVHPLASHSLGWARVDRLHDKNHWHIDEIQSDFDSVLKHSKAFHEGKLSAEGNNNIKDLLETIEPSKASEVIKTLSGSHHDIEHAIHSAVHELARNNNIDSISMDSSADQVNQAGLNPNKPLPSKHKRIYEERPKKLGYKEVNKESLFGKAPSLKEIKSNIQDTVPDPEDEYDNWPTWESSVREPQWNQDSSVQFKKLYKTYRKAQSLLAKGAVRRLFGKPDVEKRTKWVAERWQRGFDPEDREELADRSISRSEKERMLNKLAGRTKMRRNPLNGKREFLLHRGVSHEEHLDTNHPDHVNYNKTSSWTPHYNTARDFALEYQDTPTATSIEDAKKRVHSAWINEDHLSTMPGQLTGHGGEFSHEYEVIAKPHFSMKASPSDVHAKPSMKLVKSISKIGEMADDPDDKKYTGDVATFNLSVKGAGKPTVTPTASGYWLHTVKLGNMYYHVLKTNDDPSDGNELTSQAAGAVARIGGNQHTLVDLAVRHKNQGVGRELVDAIKNYHKSPDIDLARVNKADHSAENWEDHNSDVYDNLIVGYPSQKMGKGVMGAAMHGKKVGEKTAIVKPGLQESALLHDIASYPNNEHFLDNNFTPAHREAAYHFLADRIFKLGDYVPKTSVFKHPFVDDHYSAQEVIPDASPARDLDYRQLSGVKNPEDLFKLALMDGVLANHDRHGGNYLFTRDGDIRLIDNGFSFDFGHAFSVPQPRYATQIWSNSVPKSTHKWIQELDTARLKKAMESRKFPEKVIDQVMKRFEKLRQWSKTRKRNGNTLADAFSLINKEEEKPMSFRDKIKNVLNFRDDPDTVKIEGFDGFQFGDEDK